MRSLQYISSPHYTIHKHPQTADSYHNCMEAEIHSEDCKLQASHNICIQVTSTSIISYLVSNKQLYAVRLFELMANEMFRKELAKLNVTTKKIPLDQIIMHTVLCKYT